MLSLSFVHLIIFLAVPPAHCESFSSWAAKARKAERRGETAAALEAWSNAIGLWKKTDGRLNKARAHSARADLLEKSGETASAVGELSKAISLGLRNVSVFQRRGRLYLRRERTAEAISDFYSAARVDINAATVYADRARAYEKLGDAKFAQEDYRTACRLGHAPSCAPGRTARPSSTRHARDACLQGIDDCAERLNSLSVCVKRAPVCEVKGVADCCPRRCVALFLKTATPNRSDAEVFRRVFSVKGSCWSPR